MGEPTKRVDAPSSGGTSLLHLDDDLLLSILFHLPDAPAIVSLGAVNKRLNTLHFSVSRISATITTRDPADPVAKLLASAKVLRSTIAQLKMQAEAGGESVSQEDVQQLLSVTARVRQIPGLGIVSEAPSTDTCSSYSEAHLYSLLAAVSRRGKGLLQKLRVSIDQDKDRRDFRNVDLARLDWISLVSSSLQSLELGFFKTRAAPGRVFLDLATCTNLVSLTLTCGRFPEFLVKSEMLAQLIAACSKLESFSINALFSEEEGTLELASKSLKKLSLIFATAGDEGVYLRLEIPALTHLTTSLRVREFDLRSHSLRSLRMESLRMLSSSCPPMPELEVLCTGENWSVEALDQVLGRVTGRRLGTLVVSDVSVPVSELVMIAGRRLKEVNKLEFWLQGRFTSQAQAGAPGVKVDEIVVVAAARQMSESDQYEHLFKSVVMLGKSFASVQGIRCVVLEHVKPGSFLGCGEASQRAVEDLRCDFPGLVSCMEFCKAGLVGFSKDEPS